MFKQGISDRMVCDLLYRLIVEIQYGKGELQHKGNEKDTAD